MLGLSPAAFCCSSYLFQGLITARVPCCHFPPTLKLLTWTKHTGNRLDQTRLNKHTKFFLTSGYCPLHITIFAYIHALGTITNVCNITQEPTTQRHLGQVCNAKRTSKLLRLDSRFKHFLILSTLPACLASYNCICIHFPGSNLSVKE